MAVICDVCEALGVFQESPHGAGAGPGPPKQSVKKQHATMRDLHLSAENGCVFCHCVWAKFKGQSWCDEQDREFELEAGDEILAEINIDLQAQHGNDLNGLEGLTLIFSATDGSPDNDGRYYGRYRHARLELLPAVISPEERSRLTVSRVKNFGSALDIVKQALPYQSAGIWPGDSTGTESSWKQARTWLTTCLSEHSECFPDPELQTWHPTRLLHIRNSDPLSVHLVIGDEIPKHAKYFTLSHCWGDIKMFKLLESNIEELKEAVPIDKLPRTFQECIEFVSSTDFRYVWIDSVCIVQDSETDMRAQFPLMSRVYPGAICNIAANASSDGSGGLFRRRDARSIMPLYLAVEGREPLIDRLTKPASTSNVKRTLKSLFKRRVNNFKPKTVPTGLYMLIGDDTFWAREIVNGPLSKRAWVFQEYLLARRTLHFGADQLLFECCRSKYCEGCPIGLPPRLMYHADYFTHNKRMKQPFVVYEFERKEHMFGALSNWSQIIAGYNSLALKDPSDKLPAISGVAQEFQKAIKSRYFAGMWEDCLLSQLLWRVIYFAKRPDEYRAPTWSWASVDGLINTDMLGELAVATWSGRKETQESSSTTVFAEIVGIHIFLEDDRIETGRIKDGLLRMRGRLIPVSFTLISGDEDHNPGVLKFAMEDPRANTDESLGLLYIDDAPTAPLEGDFFCVPLVRQTLDSCKGMLLRATDSARGRFERIGTFEGGSRSVRYFCEERGKEDCVEEKFYINKTGGEFYTYEFDIV